MQPESIRGKFSDLDLGHMVGNAMSLNVIQRLLFQVFRHLGWIPPDLEDEWATGAALQKLLKQPESTPDRIIGECVIRGAANRIRRLLVDSGASFHIAERKNAH